MVNIKKFVDKSLCLWYNDEIKWELSLIKDKWRESPKAVVSYTPALARVHLSKPAQVRKDPIIYKTGGSNNEAGCSGKNVDLNASKEGTLVDGK